MKSTRLTEVDRKQRREKIIGDRNALHAHHMRSGRSTIQYRTMRKIFIKKRFGRIAIERDYGPYPHSSTRQRARYARQIAAGQIRMEGVSE